MFRRGLPKPKGPTPAQIELHITRKDVMETSFRTIMGIKDAEVLRTR